MCARINGPLNGVAAPRRNNRERMRGSIYKVTSPTSRMAGVVYARSVKALAPSAMVTSRTRFPTVAEFYNEQYFAPLGSLILARRHTSRNELKLPAGMAAFLMERNAIPVDIS